MSDQEPKTKKKKKDQHSTMVTGIILLGIGVLFLLNNFDVFFIEESWPFILIIVGLALLIGKGFGNRDSEASPAPPTA